MTTTFAVQAAMNSSLFVPSCLRVNVQRPNADSILCESANSHEGTKARSVARERLNLRRFGVDYAR
jgi:hypothetical protein